MLVHCNGGKGRTGLLIVACLKHLGISQTDATNKIRKARPGMLHNPAQQAYLMWVEKKLKGQEITDTSPRTGDTSPKPRERVFSRSEKSTEKSSDSPKITKKEKIFSRSEKSIEKSSADISSPKARERVFSRSDKSTEKSSGDSPKITKKEKLFSRGEKSIEKSEKGRKTIDAKKSNSGQDKDKNSSGNTLFRKITRGFSETGRKSHTVTKKNQMILLRGSAVAQN